MKKKILIADDDYRIRELVAATLGDDFLILEAKNGEEAVAITEAEKPDLIIMDIMMPRMNGYEACRRTKINEATRSIPVVMLTGLGKVEEQRRGFAAGADDYFIKPFSPLALLDKVYQILEKR